MLVTRRRPGQFLPFLMTFAGVLILIRTLLTEANYPDPGAFKRYEPAAELLVSEREYLHWAADHIQWVARFARIRSVRYVCIALVSGLSALAVTLALALSSPSWVPAVLGFIAAAGQFYEGLVRDREQSNLDHQLAVKLQRLVRAFQLDADNLTSWALRERFKELQRAFEDTKDEYGSQILKVREQGPPPLSR